MRHIFTPTGMTNVSDMQAVFDRVEAVLVGMEQPVPVVPVIDAMAYAFHHALTDSSLGDDDVEDIKAGLRAALVNGFNSQPAPVVPDDLLSMAASAIEDLLEHTDPNTSYYSAVWADVHGKLRAAMLAAAPQSPGSEPAAVPGKWIPVSERMPERGDWLVTDGCDFDVQLFDGEQFIPGFVWEDKITHWMPLPATPQEVK
nr:DUF551 domain-containing protein [Klebsiella pneumoniae]